MASAPMLLADPGNSGNPLTGITLKLDEILLAIQGIEYPTTVNVEGPVEVSGTVGLEEGTMVHIADPILYEGGTVNLGSMVEVMGTVELGNNEVIVTNLDEISIEAGASPRGEVIDYMHDRTGYGPWVDVSAYDKIYIHIWSQGDYRIAYLPGMDLGGTNPMPVAIPTDLGNIHDTGYTTFELPVTSSHIQIISYSLEAQVANLSIYIYGKPI